MSAVAHIQEYKTGLFYTDEFRGDMSWNGYEHNVLLRNDGPDARGRLEFTDVAMALGADRVKDARGTAMADFDNDGDLDIVINNNPGDSRNQKRARATLLRNEIAKRSRSGSKLARGGVDRNRFQSRGYRRYREHRGCWKPPDAPSRGWVWLRLSARHPALLWARGRCPNRCSNGALAQWGRRSVRRPQNPRASAHH